MYRPILFIALAACFGSAAAQVYQSADGQGRDPDVITRAEIQDHLNYTALEVIQQFKEIAGPWM